MSPITSAILGYAAQHPNDDALAIADRCWSWSALANEIIHRAQDLSAADDGIPTFSVIDSSTSESVLVGLARLHRGLPIIGTTSGSTAAAKRYQRSQASWVASFTAHQHEFAIHPSDVVIAPGSLAHSLFSYALCHSLFVGAKVVLSDSFRPDRTLQQIRDHHASVLYATPTQLKLIAQAYVGPASGPAIASLRLLLASGSRWFGEIAGDLAGIFPAAEIIEFYGASETSFVSLARHSTDAALPAGSIGKPFHGVDIRLGQDGLICVHSQASFDGYLGEPPADFTDHVDADGRRWISVGDIGSIDASGYLHLSGRQSRKIVASGKNLYPEEIEQCLLMHPAIDHAAVFGLKDPVRGERLAAAIAIKPGQDAPSRAEVIAHLRPMLEDFKIPRDLVVFDVWPLTATGKTDFACLREQMEKQ
jgi:long-chain acyl-CoA synthetase